MKQRDLARFLAAPLLAVFATGILGGCAFRTGDMTIISGANVGLNPEPIRHSVEGKDCVQRIFGLIPIGGWLPNLEEAIDRAMAQVPEANLMTDIVIYEDLVWYLVGRQICYRVHGDPGELR